MAFDKYEYRRPDMDTWSREFSQLLDNLDSADSAQAQSQAISGINKLRKSYVTMSTLAFIGHTQDVTDNFYLGEKKFFDSVSPTYQQMTNKYYAALSNSRFKGELEPQWGTHLFRLAESSLATFSPEVSADIKKENELSGKYMGLIASSKVPFEGKELNIMELMPHMESKDRDTRRAAHQAYAGVLAANEQQLDQLYHDLVSVRTDIARKLGFDNYVGLGYARLQRLGYTPAMVDEFRQQVRQHVVPLLDKLKQRQAKRLGVDSLKYYDEDLKFSSGNAAPQGGPREIIENSKKMYREMSPETDEFFQFMMSNDLLDIIDRDNKAKMGYCTLIPDYQAPFIFACLNGTAYDASVVTHEAGHAFQNYCNRDFEVYEYANPTAEAAETHAIAMEMFAWPWLELFFGPQADKYKFAQINDAITYNLAMCVMGDEFQTWVYQHPEATPGERKAKWQELEKIYWPYRDNADNDLYSRGGFWFRFPHFFQFPLYLIDYALAQICAFQFFAKAQQDRQQAWADYVNLCKAGGSLPFDDLLAVANLKSPFEGGCVQWALEPIARWLDTVDDRQF